MSSPNFQAAVRLRQLRRFDQAEAELKLHLASEPDDAAAYAELALCLKEEERRLPEALAAIERAVGLDPEEPSFQGWRCFILCQMERGEEALAAAYAAISMDPEYANGWAEQSRAYHVLRRWKDSEAAARKALALAPDHSVALNLLSSALQMQGKSESGIGVAEQLLARDPEESYAHANMGWAKLRLQNYKEAEVHFREALRLEPGQEFARSGLIECFKARAPHYRLFLRWSFWMSRFSEGQQWGIWIAMYVLYRVGRGMMASVHPVAVGAVVAIWLAFAFGSHLASGLGHALLLFDRSARLCLTRLERLDGALVGGLVFSGLVAGGLGLTALPQPVAYAGLLLFAAAVPGAYAVLNTRLAGRWAFGAITALSVAGAIHQIYTAVIAPWQTDPPEWFFFPLLACVLSTWLGNSSKLVKRP